MLFFSIGLTGSFSAWCDRVLIELVARSFASTVERVLVNTLEELSKALISSSATHIVVACRRPAMELQTELLKSGRPFLIARHHPYSALHNLISGEYELPAAVREIANSCAALLKLGDLSNGLTLTDQDAADDPLEIIQRIAQNFGLNASPDDIEEIVATIPPRDRA